MIFTNVFAHTHADALCRRISELICPITLKCQASRGQKCLVSTQNTHYEYSLSHHDIRSAVPYCGIIPMVNSHSVYSRMAIHVLHTLSSFNCDQNITATLLLFLTFPQNFISPLLHCCSLWCGLLFPLCLLLFLLLLLCCPLFVITLLLVLLLTFNLFLLWKIFLAFFLFITTSLILWVFRLIVTCALKTQTISL